ncbi:MAG TPA: PfkB family carbohydrate kinase [Jatrophihabitans sp.]|nr:PfkB family carbohydrate kinase [Jatrophihabitans sp.]
MRICAVGDNVVDRYLDQGLMYPGGNAVNVAVHARRCGADTGYIGALGDDAAGKVLADVLRSEDVDTARTRIVPGPNAWATVRLVDGERVFGSGSVGVSKFILTRDDLAYLRRFDLIHTGDCSTIEAQLPALAAAGPVSYDFSDRPRSYAEPLLPHVTLATFSAGGSSDAEVAELAGWAHSLGPGRVVITRGSAGAALYDGTRMYHERAVPVPVIDTLGAGDAFIARVCVELLAGTDPQRTLAAACAYAMQTCQSVGAFGYPSPDPAALGAAPGHD